MNFLTHGVGLYNNSPSSIQLILAVRHFPQGSLSSPIQITQSTIVRLMVRMLIRACIDSASLARQR
jgi:hypothetical protein